MLKNEILERLFRRHYSEMSHLARTLLGADEDAEDTVQDVFMRLMEKDITPEMDGIRSYLMTAVHHSCMNIIRRTSLRQQVKNLYPVDEAVDQQPADSMTERLDIIQTCADELDEPHHSIFHLRFDDDLTLKEIAQRLGMNQNTVYKYLQQSIQQIRSKLTDKNDNRNGHKQRQHPQAL